MNRIAFLLACLFLFLVRSVLAGPEPVIFQDGFEQPAPQPPGFEGVLLAYSPDPGKVTLEWLAAFDDTTAPEAIQYRVYKGAGTLASDIAEGQLPEVTLVGELAYTFQGLTAEEEVWFAVIAVDEDGEPSPGIHVIGVTPTADPLTAKAELKNLAELGITVEQTGFDVFTLSGPGAAGIGVGDLILIENTFGRTLRQVLTSNVNGSSNEITTIKASMSDLVQSGDLRISANVLLDNSTDAATQPLSRNTVLTAVETQQPRYSRTASDDGRLVLETHDYGSSDSVPKKVASPQSVTSLADGVNLEYKVTAGLTMQTDARWDEGFVDTPVYIKGVVIGSLTIDALASYTIDGAVNYDLEKELLSRTFNFFYTVGGVPVFQEVKVQLMAGLEFSADASFNMELTGHAQKAIAFGFEWSEAGGFNLIREDGFDNVISFNLTGKAAAKGALKIYPVISTRLYRAAQVSLFVVPEFTLDAEARLLPLPAEINKFDLDFWVKGFVEADLTIFDQELARWNSDKAQLLHVPVFSQPEIAMRRSSAQLDTCGTRKIFLSVADGYNNAVLPGNISWTVDGPPGSSLLVSESGSVAEFSVDNPGDYTINVSAFGDGFLGVLGTRYTSTDINVVQSEQDPCQPNNFDVGVEDVISCVPLDMGLWDTIVPSKNTIVPGESLDFKIPMYCENGCGVYSWFGASGVKGSPTEQGARYDLIAGGGTYNDLFIPPDVSTLGLLETSISSVDFPPGLYSTYIGFHVYTPTILNHAVYSDPYNNIGAEARKSYPLSYDLQATYWPDYPNDPHETCQGVNTGIPVMPVRVVAGGLDNDEDDVPEDSHELEINAPHVMADFDDNEDDWFAFDFEPGPYEGGIYDADAPFDPLCPVEISLRSEQDFTHYLTLFPDLESSRSLTGALISGHQFVYQPTPDLQYYLLAQSDNFYPGKFEYSIEVREACDPEPSPFPMLTGPVELSQSAMATNSPFNITIDFTNNTDRAQARMTSLADGAQISCFGQNSGLLGQTTTTLSCSAPGAAGEFVVDVILYPENCCHQSYYVKDDLFSETQYTFRGENWPDIIRIYTDIELPIIDVNSP